MRISWLGSRFSAPVYTSPGAHPNACRTGTWSSPQVKCPRRVDDYQPPSSAEVKERVELHINFPSGSSWPVLGRTLPLPLSSAGVKTGWSCTSTPPIYLIAKPLLPLCAFKANYITKFALTFLFPWRQYGVVINTVNYKGSNSLNSKHFSAILKVYYHLQNVHHWALSWASSTKSISSHLARPKKKKTFL
jgi:hypothetical protein